MLKTYLPNKVKWGRQIKLLIKGVGVTQKEIAQRSGNSEPTIKKILDGNGTHDQLSQLESILIDITEGK